MIAKVVAKDCCGGSLWLMGLEMTGLCTMGEWFMNSVVQLSRGLGVMVGIEYGFLEHAGIGV